MKVLHVIESLDPSHGGPPEVAASLAAAQANLDGVPCVSIASHADAADAKLTAHVPGFDRVHAIDIPRPRGLLGGVFDAGLSKRFAQLAREHDVVHLHNVWDPILPVAARGCRSAGVPYVITPHGMLDTWSLAQRATKKRIAMASTHRALLHRAAAFHCLNEHEATTVAALRFGPTTHVVPNGLWLQRVDDARRDGGSFRAARPELRQDPFVLFLSRLHRKKGLDHLLPAFERLAATHPTLRLVIAGPDGGDGAFVNDAKAKSAFGERIHVVGPLYGREKFAALAETICFVLPSRQEGFPIAVLEALGARAPVVVSPECHVDEVQAVGAGFVAPLNAQAIAEAIDRVLATPDTRRHFGEAGRRLVETNYIWQRVAQQSLEMYRAVVRPR